MISPAKGSINFNARNRLYPEDQAVGEAERRGLSSPGGRPRPPTIARS